MREPWAHRLDVECDDCGGVWYYWQDRGDGKYEVCDMCGRRWKYDVAAAARAAEVDHEGAQASALGVPRGARDKHPDAGSTVRVLPHVFPTTPPPPEAR